MDSTLLANAGVTSGTVAIILIVYHIVKSIINKRIISDCCGRTGEVGIGVSNMPDSMIHPEQKESV